MEFDSFHLFSPSLDAANGHGAQLTSLSLELRVCASVVKDEIKTRQFFEPNHGEDVDATFFGAANVATRAAA